MGVVVVPGLTAVNAPVFREDVKMSTGTVLLVGSLFRQKDVMKGFVLNYYGLFAKLFIFGGSELTLCIPAVDRPSVCALGSSRPHTHSANLSQDCTPAGHAEQM